MYRRPWETELNRRKTAGRYEAMDYRIVSADFQDRIRGQPHVTNEHTNASRRLSYGTAKQPRSSNAAIDDGNIARWAQKDCSGLDYRCLKTFSPRQGWHHKLLGLTIDSSQVYGARAIVWVRMSQAPYSPTVSQSVLVSWQHLLNEANDQCRRDLRIM